MNASTEFSNLPTFVAFVVGIINSLLVILIALALLVFFKGLVGFISKAGDAKNHQDGKNLMIWGLVGLFAMVSVFGILQFAYNDFGFTRPFGLPTLPINQAQ